jgi:hypothetical protein
MQVADEAMTLLRILIGKRCVSIGDVLGGLGGCIGRFASAVDEIDEFIQVTGIDDIRNCRLGLTWKGQQKAEAELLQRQIGELSR